jgi:hypothetical protein
MDDNQEWGSLAADWQRQATPAIDIDAIRDEAERRGRQLRRIVWLEVGFTALVILLCMTVVVIPGSDPFEMLLFGGMAVVLAVYQVLMVRLRRHDFADAGRDAMSLLDREIRRATTVLRYWRWGMWTALAMWLVIYAMLLFGMANDWRPQRIGGLVGGVGINVLVFPAMGVYGLWRCGQARARLLRFGALREQLREP